MNANDQRKKEVKTLARIERSIEVKAQPEKIWGLLTDYGRWPSFMKEVKKIDYLTEERGVGSKTHWIIESGDSEIEWEADTTEWIEN